MRDGWPIFTAAAVQAAPVYLDRDATLDKACALIRAAARVGAGLIAFPEAFVPGFPHWIYLDRPQANEQYFVDLVREAVEVPGPVTETIGPVWGPGEDRAAGDRLEHPGHGQAVQLGHRVSGTGRQVRHGGRPPAP